MSDPIYRLWNFWREHVQPIYRIPALKGYKPNGWLLIYFAIGKCYKCEMGLTWCRERIEQAQNSKSPVDRILVCCSNVIKPKPSYSHSQGKIVNDFVYKGMRNKNVGISPPVPIHAVPPRTRNRNSRITDWQTCTLHVPDDGKPPVPPPRKKRKPKLNSMEVLNSELPKLHSPSYVIFSENLLSKNNANPDPAETNETDVLCSLEMKPHYKGRTSGYERFVKSSGNRMRKLKSESYPNDGREKKVKNDNEKKGEEKIKHISTVSLPNYNELIKPSRKVATEVENGDDKTGNQSTGLKHPRRNSSTISLPGEGSNSILSSLSEATIHRLESYMKKCRSFGALKPQQLLEKLEEFNKTHRSASESSDSWSGLDDWDLGVIEYCDSEQQAPPLTPKSTIPPKIKTTEEPKTKKEEQPQTAEETPDKVPFLQRYESVIEGVPIEWFLNPSLRPPAIMPPPESQETTKTPPPSSENHDDTIKEDDQSEEHSSLLNILMKYREEENEEPEVTFNVTEIIDEFETPDPLTFSEVNVDIPLTETLNPFLPLKDRSGSLALEEQIKILQDEKIKQRSPSVAYDSSAHLLKELQKKEEEIEQEILLRPKQLIQGLRRESLRQSLPEDAFEAFTNKKNSSLADSLNNFLGFQDEGGSQPKENKAEGDEKTPPPLPSSPPPIVVNPPEDNPHSLVNVNDNPKNI